MGDAGLPANTYRWKKHSYDHNNKIVGQIRTSGSLLEDVSTRPAPENVSSTRPAPKNDSTLKRHSAGNNSKSTRPGLVNFLNSIRSGPKDESKPENVTSQLTLEDDSKSTPPASENFLTATRLAPEDDLKSTSPAQKVDSTPTRPGPEEVSKLTSHGSQNDAKSKSSAPKSVSTPENVSKSTRAAPKDDSTSTRPAPEIDSSTRPAPEDSILVCLKLQLLENMRRICQLQNFVQDLVCAGQQHIDICDRCGHPHEHLDISMPALRVLPKDVRDRIKTQIMERKNKLDTVIKEDEELRSVLYEMRNNLFRLGLNTKFVEMISGDDCNCKEEEEEN